MLRQRKYYSTERQTASSMHKIEDTKFGKLSMSLTSPNLYSSDNARVADFVKISKLVP
jgi:hypothetical protein